VKTFIEFETNAALAVRQLGRAANAAFEIRGRDEPINRSMAIDPVPSGPLYCGDNQQANERAASPKYRLLRQGLTITRNPAQPG
jgi:hypothetical protein